MEKMLNYLFIQKRQGVEGPASKATRFEQKKNMPLQFQVCDVTIFVAVYYSLSVVFFLN